MFWSSCIPSAIIIYVDASAFLCWTRLSKLERHSQNADSSNDLRRNCPSKSTHVSYVFSGQTVAKQKMMTFSVMLKMIPSLIAFLPLSLPLVAIFCESNFSIFSPRFRVFSTRIFFRPCRAVSSSKNQEEQFLIPRLSKGNF